MGAPNATIAPSAGRRVKLEASYLAVAIGPEALDAQSGELKVAWATEDFLLDRFIPDPDDPFSAKRILVRFGFDRSNIRTERLDRGLHVLHNHGFSGLKNPLLGRATSWGIEGVAPKRQAVATIRFTKRPDEEAQGVITDIRDRILTSLSFGTWFHELQPTDEAKDGIPIYLASDWEPFEITFTEVPRNPKATTLSADSGAVADDSTVECIVLQSVASTTGRGDAQSIATANAAASARSNRMDPVQGNGASGSGNGDSPAASATVTAPTTPKGPDEATLSAARTQAADEARKAERARCSAIRVLASKHQLDDETVESLLSSGATIEKAREVALDKLAERQRAAGAGPATASVRVGAEPGDHANAGVEAALLLSLGYKAFSSEERKKAEDVGRKWQGLRTVELARRFLETRGISTEGKGGLEVAKLALGMHGLSDFPKLMANVQNKFLQAGYDAAPSSFEKFAKERNAKDFKPIATNLFGLGSVMTEILKGGSIRYGTFGEGGETFAVKRYGVGITLTPEALVNDDLDALSDIPRAFGEQTRILSNRLAWALLTANVTMADGVALFHATHKNELSPDKVITATGGLDGLRKLIRLQTDPDGNVLNLAPRTLVVGPSLEEVALQKVAAVVAAQTSNVNTFRGTELVVEQELEAAGVSGGATRYFFATDRVPGFEVAYLDGNKRPRIESMRDFDSSALKTKAEFEVGVCVPDHRAWVRSNGTTP